MRYLYSLVVLLLSISSCGPVHKLGKQPDVEPPFVKLKTGIIIHAKQVGQEMDFNGNRIIADDSAYDNPDVAMMSNGEQTYTNLGYGIFGPKIAQGKINVYSNSDAANFGFVGGIGEQLYIQKNGTDKVDVLKYKNLKKMIPPNSAGSGELHKLKTVRMISKLTMLAGFASFVGGAVMLSNSVLQDHTDEQMVPGKLMMFGGMALIPVGFCPLFYTSIGLRRTVAAHNGVFKP